MDIARFLVRRVFTGLIVMWLVATAAFFLFFARPVTTVARPSTSILAWILA